MDNCAHEFGVDIEDHAGYFICDDCKSVVDENNMERVNHWPFTIKLIEHPTWGFAFDIIAQCGHTYQVYREPGLTTEEFVQCYGEVEMCGPCRWEDLDRLLNEAEYRRNPDGPALGRRLLTDGITWTITAITPPDDQSQH